MPMMAPKNMEMPIMLKIDYCETMIGDDWELSASDITVMEMLGEGAFGLVYKGYIKGPLINSKVKPEFRNKVHIPVAMKLLKGEGFSLIFFSPFLILFLSVQTLPGEVRDMAF